MRLCNILEWGWGQQIVKSIPMGRRWSARSWSTGLLRRQAVFQKPSLGKGSTSYPCTDDSSLVPVLGTITSELWSRRMRLHRPSKIHLTHAGGEPAGKGSLQHRLVLTSLAQQRWQHCNPLSPWCLCSNMKDINHRQLLIVILEKGGINRFLPIESFN